MAPRKLLVSLPPRPETWFQHTKAWFKYSETILLARIEVSVGFLAIVFASMDWSPLFGLTNFDTKQVVYLGGLSVFKGLVTEWARRHRDPVINAEDKGK